MHTNFDAFDWASLHERYLPRPQFGPIESPLTDSDIHEPAVFQELQALDSLQNWDGFARRAREEQRQPRGTLLPSWSEVAASLRRLSEVRDLLTQRPPALTFLETHRLHPGTAHLLRCAERVALWEDKVWIEQLAGETTGTSDYLGLRWSQFATAVQDTDLDELLRASDQNDQRAFDLAARATSEVNQAFHRSARNSVLWIECGFIRYLPSATWAFQDNAQARERVLELSNSFLLAVQSVYGSALTGALLRPDFSYILGHRFTFVVLLEDRGGFHDHQQCETLGLLWNKESRGTGCFFNHNLHKRWSPRAIGVISAGHQSGRQALEARVTSLMLADRHMHYPTEQGFPGLWTRHV
ncbi:hypothetical protein DBA29_12670 [Xenophilus aerolatus]|nr:hypothetical protein [Xenophilus aerolatus]